MRDEDVTDFTKIKEPTGLEVSEDVRPDETSLRRRQLKQWGHWSKRTLGGASLLVFRILAFLSQTEAGLRIVVEGELEPLLRLLQQSFEALQPECERISCSVKFDYRSGCDGRLASKVASVEKKLGRTLKK